MFGSITLLTDMTGDRSVLDAAMPEAENFLTNSLPLDLGKIPPETPNFRKVEHPWVVSASQEMKENDPIRDEGIVVSTQVAYTGEGGRLYDIGEEVSGGTSVVSHYLTTGT